jgi:hypothetical protein
MTNDLIKSTQIIIILSPLFTTVLLIAFLSKKIIKDGTKKLEKFSLYWFFLTIIISTLLFYGLISGNISSYSVPIGIISMVNAWSMYRKLKSKPQKNKKDN